MHSASKSYVEDNEITLNEYYDDAVLSFVDRVLGGEEIQYKVSPKDSKYTSLWIDDKILNKVAALAERDKVSANRVFYTGIAIFLSDNSY